MSSRKVDWTDQGGKKPYKKKYQSKGISSGGYNPYATDEDSRSVDNRSVSSSGSKFSRSSGKYSGTPRSVKSTTIMVKKNSGKLSANDIKFVINQKDQDLAFVRSRKLLLDTIAVDYDEGDKLLAWFEDDEDPEYEDPTPPSGDNPTQQEMAKHTSSLRRIDTKNDELKRSKAALTNKIISCLDSTFTVILETMV